MPKSKDFAKIHENFISEYGSIIGERAYHAWLNARGYDDTKSYKWNAHRQEPVYKGKDVKRLYQ